MKKLLSPGAMVRKVSDTARRFPLAVAAVVALVVLAFVSLHGPEDAVDPRWWVFLPFVLYAGVVATLALEERLTWWQTLLVGVGVAALWGARCLFLPEEFYDVPALMVEVAVVNAAAFFAGFFVAFLRRDTDACWWNFTLRTVVRLMLGCIFAGILFGGLALAFYAVKELFGAELPDEIFIYLAIVCWMLFAPLYVMAGVPSGAAKHNPELHSEPVLKVLGLYILAPISAVYALILYVYLFKIIAAWELPDGLVSWLVTVLAGGGLSVTLLLWPLRMQGGNRMAGFLARWSGVVIAPLLMLMTVGIARRVSDYGWTPNRCYILLLNLWFYGVYVWLFIVRGRRVKWILISAVVVAFVSSVGPWSLARVTPREGADEDGATTEEEYDYERFSSDNALVENTPQTLDAEYGGFAHIVWYGSDAVKAGSMDLYEHDGHLVIGIVESDGDDTREFRVPLQQAGRAKEIRGEDFTFIVGDCSGIRWPEKDSIRVDQLTGYLFYR
jgi:hypothetical protein